MAFVLRERALCDLLWRFCAWNWIAVIYFLSCGCHATLALRLVYFIFVKITMRAHGYTQRIFFSLFSVMWKWLCFTHNCYAIAVHVPAMVKSYSYFLRFVSTVTSHRLLANELLIANQSNSSTKSAEQLQITSKSVEFLITPMYNSWQFTIWIKRFDVYA